MAALGTFSVTVTEDVINGQPATSAVITVKPNAPYYRDPDADKIYVAQTSGNNGASALPATLVLPTDVTTGISATIGYTVTVRAVGAEPVTTTFAARPAGLTIALADLAGDAPATFTADANDTYMAGRVNDPTSQTAIALTAVVARLKTWAKNPDLLVTGTITRDSNGAATSAPVVWPDGTPGTYTATTLSTAFPGAVDAYTITYGSPVTKTYTQPAVTRDASGAATNVPAITVA